jgi:2-amino-4-hydroxy-6-hydroxymethyldihydropteridine diphosphokinase
VKLQSLHQSNLVLLLGTNLGDRITYLEQATIQLIKVFNEPYKTSSIYETAAWGNTQQPSFLNQVIIFKTSLSPQQSLQHILSIEKGLGRERLIKMGPRTIDIDILFYEDQIVQNESLTIPHPHLQDRKFVLEPLLEIIPNYIHPKFKKSVQVLFNECTDTLNVKKF